MDIKKADYHTIMMFGGIDELNKKLRMDKKKLSDIIDIKNTHDETLLEIALSFRKFELAKHLLLNGAKVNNVSKDGHNEFHFLAANLYFDGAIECAQLLLEKDTDLSLQENRFSNTAMFALCLEALKHPSPSILAFICACLEKNQRIDEKNIRGNNVRTLIENRGTPEMKKILGI